jgi:hypothetical protein
MKMSATDPESKHYEAYCDGYKLIYCFFADEEAGYADCYQVNSDNELIFRGEKLIPYRVYGKIELRKK